MIKRVERIGNTILVYKTNIPEEIKCTLRWDEGFVEFKDYDEETEEWITGRLSFPECEEDE